MPVSVPGWCEVDRTQVAVGLVAGKAGVAFVPACSTTVSCPGVVYRTLSDPAPRLRMAAVWRQEERSQVLAGFIAARPWHTDATEPPRGNVLGQLT